MHDVFLRASRGHWVEKMNNQLFCPFVETNNFKNTSLGSGHYPNIKKILYNWMKSNWKSFGGDVVLNRSNLAYRDEGIIEYQKYDTLIFWEIYYEDFKFLNWHRKMYIKRNTAQQQGTHKVRFQSYFCVIIQFRIILLRIIIIIIKIRTYLHSYIWS